MLYDNKEEEKENSRKVMETYSRDDISPNPQAEIPEEIKKEINKFFNNGSYDKQDIQSCPYNTDKDK